jgi:hypothetical protein
MPGEIIPECRAKSSRNAERHQIGMVGDISADSRATSPGIRIGASDETEGMLATQMVATHAASITTLRRLKDSQTLLERDRYGSLAVKLLRAFAAQVEALQRYRGKGQQKVTVEYVHVHAGGQAIVGAVTPGGGGKEQSAEQAHAPSEITHEPGTPMWSQDPEREAVPVPGGARKAPV